MLLDESSRCSHLRSALEDSQRRHQAVLSSLQEHIAVLDQEGLICAVNSAWRRFAGQNGTAALQGLAEGDNFIQACRRAARAGDESANQVLDAVTSVISGNQDAAELEYPCPAQNPLHWFRINVLPIQGRRPGVVICRSDVTKLKETEINLRSALDEVIQLKERLCAENLYLHEQMDRSRCYEEIIGQSSALKQVLELVDRVASTDVNVLLLGETGTGKELFARAIHERSRRADGPLVTVNCAALPSSLIESEMFGHVRGAFTGAVRDATGRFELAEGGTLFLDEVGEIDLELQAKLLRVLEEREFEKIGSGKTIKADVRIVAATNRDLRQEARNGQFRLDLYFRLAVFPLTIPPLRHRTQDIPLLIWHFVTNKSGDLHKKITEISDASLEACLRYDWPGNVRELENVVERALILSPGNELLLDKALILPGAGNSSPPVSNTMEDVDRAHIARILEDCNWVIKGPGNAADKLGLAPSTLRYRIKKLGIRAPWERREKAAGATAD
jgi:transcriptional regulator with GAF, ATPase, and Fis domain